MCSTAGSLGYVPSPPCFLLATQGRLSALPLVRLPLPPRPCWLRALSLSKTRDLSLGITGWISRIPGLTCADDCWDGSARSTAVTVVDRWSPTVLARIWHGWSAVQHTASASVSGQRRPDWPLGATCQSCQCSTVVARLSVPSCSMPSSGAPAPLGATAIADLP